MTVLNHHYSSFISQQVQSGDYYFLDLNPPVEAQAAVVCGGCETCGEAYRIERSNFRYYSVEFVVSGRGIVQLNGVEYPLLPGSAFFYGPDIEHIIQVDPGQTMVKYFVDFVGSKARSRIAGSPLADLKPVCVDEPARIQDIYDDLQRSGNRQSAHVGEICVALLELLVLRISDHVIPAERQGAMAWEVFQKCRRHIQDHYLNIKALTEVADACHVSEAYICRLFRRYDTHSPYQLITRLKMNHAATLLLKPDMLIKEIAHQGGFRDPYHFSKTFKRVYGMSPEMFRKAREI